METQVDHFITETEAQLFTPAPPLTRLGSRQLRNLRNHMTGNARPGFCAANIPEQWLDRKMTVCDHCFRLCCWHGEFMCDDSGGAGTIDLPIRDLVAYGVEHSDYWAKALIEEGEDPPFGDRWERAQRVATGKVTPGECRECGCTDYDCERCEDKIGHACAWMDEAHTLCSACVEMCPCGSGDPRDDCNAFPGFCGTQAKVEEHAIRTVHRVASRSIGEGKGRFTQRDWRLMDISLFLVEVFPDIFPELQAATHE